MALMKTNDPRVIELLKSLGMPDNCTSAVIRFDAAGLVSAVFEKMVVGSEVEIMRLFFEDKVPINETE